MCLLAIYYRIAADAPVVVAANREEYYDRPGTPPQLLPGPLRVVAGVDPLAGGTWLGVNERGLLVAVTNRRKSNLPVNPRSRGLLARDLLHRCDTARVAAEAAARELDTGQYAGCNVLVADAETATVLHGGDWLRVRTLPTGLHILSNRDVNDASDRRVGRALSWLTERPARTAEECVTASRELCGRTDGDDPICFRDTNRGTVSSSLLVIPRRLADGVYLHAQGPPDRTPYQDYSGLMIELARGA
jgi:uncharacterized protein with NRDE domain